MTVVPDSSSPPDGAQPAPPPPAWLPDAMLVLDALPTPVLLLSPALAVFGANAAAQRLLADRPELSVQNGMLLARREAEQAEMQVIVAGALALGTARYAAFRNRQGRPTLAMQVRPLERDGLILALPASLSPFVPASLVVLTEVLRLTKAELRLASALLVATARTRPLAAFGSRLPRCAAVCEHSLPKVA